MLMRLRRSGGVPAPLQRMRVILLVMICRPAPIGQVGTANYCSMCLREGGVSPCSFSARQRPLSTRAVFARHVRFGAASGGIVGGVVGDAIGSGAGKGAADRVNGWIHKLWH